MSQGLQPHYCILRIHDLEGPICAYGISKMEWEIDFIYSIQVLTL